MKYEIEIKPFVNSFTFEYHGLLRNKMVTKGFYESKPYLISMIFNISTKSSFILHFHGQVSKGEPLTTTITKTSISTSVAATATKSVLKTVFQCHEYHPYHHHHCCCFNHHCLYQNRSKKDSIT